MPPLLYSEVLARNLATPPVPGGLPDATTGECRRSGKEVGVKSSASSGPKLGHAETRPLRTTPESYVLSGSTSSRLPWDVAEVESESDADSFFLNWDPAGAARNHTPQGSETSTETRSPIQTGHGQPDDSYYYPIHVPAPDASPRLTRLRRLFDCRVNRVKERASEMIREAIQDYVEDFKRITQSGRSRQPIESAHPDDYSFVRTLEQLLDLLTEDVTDDDFQLALEGIFSSQGAFPPPISDTDSGSSSNPPVSMSRSQILPSKEPTPIRGQYEEPQQQGHHGVSCTIC